MKPKTMVLLVVAVTCGLGASYMTSKLLAERNKPQPQEERVVVVMAKGKVPKYTVLKEPEKFFEEREVPKSAAPKGQFFRSLKEIKDKRVNKEFKADVHIAQEDVLDKMTTALPIPDGFGAIALKINATSGVSYFVTPGDKVDVLLTQRGDQPSSHCILREMLVLSVGDRIRPPDENAQSGVMQAQTVTVAVKPDEAQLIRLAETQGELSLLLRKDSDNKDDWVSSKVTTKDDLKNRVGRSATLTQPSPPPPPPAPAQPATVPLVGVPLEKIEKVAAKTDEEEAPPKPVLKPWVVAIELGNKAPTELTFFEKPDGTFTRDAAAAQQAAQPAKKDDRKK